MKAITYERMQTLLRNSVICPAGDAGQRPDGTYRASLFGSNISDFYLEFINEQDLLTQISAMEDEKRKEGEATLLRIMASNKARDIRQKPYRMLQAKKEKDRLARKAHLEAYGPKIQYIHRSPGGITELKDTR